MTAGRSLGELRAQLDSLVEELGPGAALDSGTMPEFAVLLDEAHSIDAGVCRSEMCPRVEQRLSGSEPRLIARLIEGDARWLPAIPSLAVIEVDSIAEFAEHSAEAPESRFSLQLGRQQLLGEDLAPLIATGRLDQVRDLSLANNKLGEPALLGLLEAGMLNLCLLDLDNAFEGPLSPDWVERFAAIPLPRLEALDLTFGGLGDEGVATLAKASNVPALTELILWSNLITAVGLEALVNSPLFAQLEEVVLHANQLDAAGGRVLREAPSCPAMKTLNLRFTYLTDDGTAELVQSSAFPSLQRLWLEHAYLTDASARMLASASVFPELRALELSRNEITADGLIAVLQSTTLPCLDTLNLGFTEIGDDLVDRLAEVEQRPAALENLWLWGTELTDDAQAQLARHPVLAGLDDLDFET